MGSHARRLALMLAAVALVAARKKKAQDDGGGGIPGMYTCTDTFVGAYFNCTPPDCHGPETALGWRFNESHTTDHHFIGIDGGQYLDGLPMLDTTILWGVCTANTYLSPTLKTYQTVSGDVTTITTVEHSDDGRRLLSTPGSAKIPVQKYPGRRLMEAADCEQKPKDCYDTDVMPAIDSTCDFTNEVEEFHECDSRELEWSCQYTDVETTMARLRLLAMFNADDCWSSTSYDGDSGEPTQPFYSQCDGAPEGPQNCTFTPLAAGEYATGVTITVNGDLCTACGLKSDFCPEFYDVHDCSVEWDGVTTTAPAVGDNFTVTYVINAADRGLVPSLLFTVMVAMAALLRSGKS